MPQTQPENNSPFGMVMSDRAWTSAGGGYRFGFNGMEKDDEVSGEGNSIDFGARIYDPRLRRFLSLDPEAIDYAWLSDYSYVANSPILFIDPDGKKFKIYYEVTDEDGNTSIESVTIRRINKRSLKRAVKKSGNNEFVKDVTTMLGHLKSTDAMKVNIEMENGKTKRVNVLKKLARSEETINVRKNTENKYQASTKTLLVNPSSGILFRKTDDAQLYKKHLHAESLPDNLGRNSPTSLVAHELFHSYNHLFDFKRYINRKGDQSTQKEDIVTPFKNQEEKYTTLKLQNQANEKLGEDKRFNYDAFDYETTSPTSTEPK